MNQIKVFCEDCRDDVNFVVVSEKLEGTIKGEKYSYLGKIARCTHCDSEIYVEEINDFNLKALYDEYRRKHGIVSLDMILEIPEKYSIGKRPLSLLLGWGEQTFSRYCDGDLPTKQYSDILQKIYEDPKFYESILEENKARLKNEFSYEKSKNKVEILLGDTSHKASKTDLAVNYLLYYCEDITPLALQKALYYIQGFYYAFYKEFLFDEDCQAWVHGPVYSDVYLKYRNYKFNPIESNTPKYDETKISSSERSIFDSVINHICCYSAKVLERFTHSETPWLLTRGNLPQKQSSNKIINKLDIGKYFDSVKDKYNMINPNDIKSYTSSMFEQVFWF